MDGLYCKLMENKIDLISFIKETEINRIENELTNINKNKSLYDIYYDICEDMKQMEDKNE